MSRSIGIFNKPPGGVSWEREKFDLEPQLFELLCAVLTLERLIFAELGESARLCEGVSRQDLQRVAPRNTADPAELTKRNKWLRVIGKRGNTKMYGSTDKAWKLLGLEHPRATGTVAASDTAGHQPAATGGAGAAGSTTGPAGGSAGVL